MGARMIRQATLKCAVPRRVERSSSHGARPTTADSSNVGLVDLLWTHKEGSRGEYMCRVWIMPRESETLPECHGARHTLGDRVPGRNLSVRSFGSFRGTPIGRATRERDISLNCRRRQGSRSRSNLISHIKIPESLQQLLPYQTTKSLRQMRGIHALDSDSASCKEAAR